MSIPVERVKPRPVCVIHFAKMRAYSTVGEVTYYRCQVKDCPQTAKIIDSGPKIPDSPSICPHCKEAMTVAEQKGSDAVIVLECKYCQLEMPVERVNPAFSPVVTNGW